MKTIQQFIIGKGSDGFNLIEITVALAVISFGIVAILGLLPTGLQASRAAADQTIAATLAQDFFSELRASPDWPPLTGPVTWHFSNTGVRTNSQNCYFRVHLDAEKEGALDLYRITATVVWPAPAGVASPVNTNTFITLIARYDQS